MGFMQAQMTEYQGWVRVATNSDTVLIPADIPGLDEGDVADINAVFNGTLCQPIGKNGATTEADDSVPPELRDYVGGDRLIEEVEFFNGWGVRSSAPGYMDCTEWDVYDTLEEAEEAYREEVAANNDGDYPDEVDAAASVEEGGEEGGEEDGEEDVEGED